MELFEIKALHENMKKNNIYQEQFNFTYNGKTFDVIFLIDRKPYLISFGVLKHNYFFQLNLYKGYELQMMPNEVFFKLCNILNLKPGKESFTTMKFLKYFAENIPVTSANKKLAPHTIAAHLSDTIAEGNKIYFCGWRAHIRDGKEVQNLNKTRMILGDNAYEFCKENNISSCWTDDIRNVLPYYSPQRFTRRIAK